MRLFLLFAVLIGVVVLGCSDGKLNLMLVLWTDHELTEESSSSNEVEISSSSSSIVPPPPPPSSSSSAEVVPEPSSSSSEDTPPPSSSSAEPPPPSSSSRSERPERSSGSKTNKDGEEYIDYPTLEEGENAFHANPGGVTRYWDSCRPSCSGVVNLGSQANPAPHGVAKACDKSGRKEIPLFYLDEPLDETPTTHAFFAETPNVCQIDVKTPRWPQSREYAELKAQNPNFYEGREAGAFVCLDQIPYAVNDTLAYAFTATGECGKCYQLQFTGEFHYDGNGPRAPHRALKGKTLIVMANNFGVMNGSFDIMIPGGGVGNYKDGMPLQTGIPGTELGSDDGGLLKWCWTIDQGGMPERYTLEETQACLRRRCNETFNRPNLDKAFLEGCLWHVDWLMAADNPEALYREVPCPKYLVDRYGSSIPLPRRPSTLNSGAGCEISGGWECLP